MKMERCTAAILLMLSLEALVAGRLCAAVADDGVDTIRLPSHGRPGVAGHEATPAVAAAEEARPWECCDLARCTRSFPPTCSCLDKVKKCAKTCKVCQKAGASSRYVCLDSYFGWPGPKCSRSAASGPGIAGQEATAAGATAEELVSEKSVADGEEEARPWKCCDDTLCTRSAPPTCQCLDKVKKCAKTCKVCEKAGGSNGASSRYVCRDRYFGWPGPKCSKSAADDVRNSPGIAGQEATAAVPTAEEVVSEKSVADGEEEARPWKCCDDTLCTRSAPPTCQCLDKVKKCAKTCKVCEKAGGSNGASSRYVCRDRYFGWPGPKCSKSVADDVPNSPGIAGHEATAAVATAEEVVSEKSVADGEEEARPWKCCDDTLCTRSAPPTCQCLDKVKKCAKTCKVCEKAGGSNGASSRYVCRDRYFGWPGPKCSKSVADDVRRGN